MRKFLAMFMAITFLFMNTVASAAQTIDKTESVYVNLGYFGDVDQIHVYNDCNLTGQNQVVDYGTYENVKNLTNREAVKIVDGKVVWNVEGLKRFAYNGKVSNDNAVKIPWTFEVNYKLNGMSTKPEELLGKAGTVEMVVDINANKDATPYYRNNYMLEITGSYDLNKYLSLEADEAMFVTTGRTKTLMYIVLPGQSTTLHLRIGTENFEMDGLTFAMVPVEGEILDKIGDIVKDKKDLEDAMDELNASTDVMLSAMSEMTPNLEAISSGLNTIQSGTTDIHELSGERDEAIVETKKNLEDMQSTITSLQKDIDNAIDSANDLNSMLAEVQPKFESIAKTMKLVQDNLDEISDIVEDLPDDMKEIRKTVSTTSSLVGNFIKIVKDEQAGKAVDTSKLPEQLGAIKTNAEALYASDDLALKQKGGIILQNLGAVSTTLGEIQKISADGNSASNSMIDNLSTLQIRLRNISNMIDEEDGETVIDAVDNMSALVKDMSSVLDTAIKYNQKYLNSKENLPTALTNVKAMLTELNKLDKAGTNLLTTLQKALKIVSTKIYDGSNKVVNGVSATTNNLQKIANQSGSVKNSKDTVKTVIDNRWDSIEDKTTIFNIDTKATPVSFLSDKNEAPSKVQFMLKTPDIKEVKTNAEDLEANQNDGNLWSRICVIFDKLFGWIFRLFGK